MSAPHNDSKPQSIISRHGASYLVKVAAGLTVLIVPTIGGYAYGRYKEAQDSYVRWQSQEERYRGDIGTLKTDVDSLKSKLEVLEKDKGNTKELAAKIGGQLDDITKSIEELNALVEAGEERARALDGKINRINGMLQSTRRLVEQANRSADSAASSAEESKASAELAQKTEREFLLRDAKEHVRPQRSAEIPEVVSERPALGSRDSQKPAYMGSTHR
jgi:chromosome segregation ATPase